VSELEILQILGGGGGGVGIIALGLYVRSRLVDLTERQHELEKALHAEQVERARLEGRIPGEEWLNTLQHNLAEIRALLAAHAERDKSLGRSVDDVRERVVRIEASLDEAERE